METENWSYQGLRDAPNMAEQKVETNRLSHSRWGREGILAETVQPSERVCLQEIDMVIGWILWKCHISHQNQQRKSDFAYASFFIFMTIKLHFRNALYVFAPEQLHFSKSSMIFTSTK